VLEIVFERIEVKNMLRASVWCVAVCFFSASNVFSQLVVITSAVPGVGECSMGGGVLGLSSTLQYCDESLLEMFGEDCFERSDEQSAFSVYELRITSSEFQRRFDELVQDNTAARVWITPDGVVAHLRAESVKGLGKSFRMFYQHSADGEVDALHGEKSMIEHMSGHRVVDERSLSACCFFLNVVTQLPRCCDVPFEYKDDVLWWCSQYGISLDSVEVAIKSLREFDVCASGSGDRSDCDGVVAPVPIRPFCVLPEIEEVDEEGQYENAILFCEGRVAVLDYSSAYNYLSVAARRGHAPAQWLLSCLYKDGLGVNRSEREAVRLCLDAANRGFAVAQSEIGVCYANGYGVEKDEREAVEWFRLAAAQGVVESQYNLGVCYANGYGVEKDEREAVRWYRKAADLDVVDAQFNLGVFYANGCGVEKDEREAVRWYRKAADRGHSSAQFSLGLRYYHGDGVDKDEHEAVYWYRLAAKQEYAPAQFNLGVCYCNGHGVDKDEREAFYWCRLAATQEFAEAQFALGVCYDCGHGVDQDEREAVRWYRLAADQGYAQAQNMLGLCYEDGQGVGKDERKAFYWYRLAADQGFADAQFNLGVCYDCGHGVDQDEREAVRWYRLAAGHGHAEALDSLRVLERER